MQFFLNEKYTLYTFVLLLFPLYHLRIKTSRIVWQCRADLVIHFTALLLREEALINEGKRSFLTVSITLCLRHFVAFCFLSPLSAALTLHSSSLCHSSSLRPLLRRRFKSREFCSRANENIFQILWVVNTAELICMFLHIQRTAHTHTHYLLNKWWSSCSWFMSNNVQGLG